METTPTMRRVIWSKMIEAAEERSLREITAFIFKPLLVIFFSGCMLKEGKGFDAIMQWQNFSVPMILTAVAIVYGIPPLYRLTIETGENIIDRTRRTPVTVTGASLEGAPLTELVDHLFDTQSFKRADVETTFKIPRGRVSLLGDRLEEVGILTRGENNARILAPVSREEVLKILKGKRRAEEIEREVNVVRIPSPTTLSPAFRRTLVSA